MKNLKFFSLALAVLLLAAGCNKTPASEGTASLNTGAVKHKSSQESKNSKLTAPILRASERVTKKPFGIYITPESSPVQPEKFTGYHSGVDFETFLEEQNIDVPVMAVCTGKITTKRTATGYGGVVTQQCTLDKEFVTIIYGHVRLSSVKALVGDELKAGEIFAVLGTGYSAETSGERKHLHLGIVKGHGRDIRGYVQQPGMLNDFLDVTKYY